MDNKEIMENYLLVLKSTVEVYVHGTLESTNEKVRTLLKKCLNETISNQKETYDLIKNNGWYETINIDKEKIIETLNKLKNN